MAWNEPGNGGNKRHDPWGSGDDGGRKDDGDQRPQSPWDEGNKRDKNQGNRPANLDDSLKKLKQGANQLLSKAKRAGGSGNGGGSKKHNPLMLPSGVVLVAVLVWAGSGFYQINQSEQGIVLRFGKYHDTVSSGLHWNPPLIDQVQRVNVVATRNLNKVSSFVTADSNIVNVRLSVQYQITDTRSFAINVHDPEQSLRDALDATVRRIVGGSGLQNILISSTDISRLRQSQEANAETASVQTSDESKLPLISAAPLVNDSLIKGREEIAPMVAERLQQTLDSYQMGIHIQSVNLESTTTPPEVQSAVDDAVRAREDRQRAMSEAQAYANTLQPQTEGESQRIIEQATGYRDAVVSEARGRTARFLAMLKEYKAAPDVTRERLYIETLSDIYRNSTTALVDLDKGNQSMIYLPIDQLLKEKDDVSSSATGADKNVSSQAVPSRTESAADKKTNDGQTNDQSNAQEAH